jgi:hypothetical protein
MIDLTKPNMSDVSDDYFMTPVESKTKKTSYKAAKLKKSQEQKEKHVPSASSVWIENGTSYFYKELGKVSPALDKAVYTVEITPQGEFFLQREEDAFDFPYKVYGLESKLINRVHRQYEATTGNLGLLLNGIKGTGKTVTAKQICNKLNIPVILITHHIDGAQFFINSIQQDIVVFVDEYEKVYDDKDSDMLTIMDGVLNSEHRRVFLLTTNSLWINENLLQRPGRIRYLKTFGDLTVPVIEEIIDDRLNNKEFRESCIKFISNLQIITVDIVKAIIDECNIHNEGPDEFKDVFNVKKIIGKFNVSILDPTDGKTLISFKKGVPISPKSFEEEYEGQFEDTFFSVGGHVVGRILEIVDRETIKVTPWIKGKAKESAEPVTYKIEHADSIHSTYNRYAF